MGDESMLELESVKSREQIIKLLQKQTVHVKAYHFLVPFAFFLLLEHTFAGRIGENKFWIFTPCLLSRRHTLFRVFHGTFTEEDNKTIITGKFKFPACLLFYNLIVLLIFFYFIFSTGFPIDIISALFIFIFFAIFVTIVLFFNFLHMRKYENKTIEFLEEILD
jgi:hypothetical protein